MIILRKIASVGCGNWDETDYPLILVKKEIKNRHDQMGKEICWELFKKLKFPLGQSAGAVEYTDCTSAEG